MANEKEALNNLFKTLIGEESVKDVVRQIVWDEIESYGGIHQVIADSLTDSLSEVLTKSDISKEITKGISTKDSPIREAFKEAVDQGISYDSYYSAVLEGTTRSLMNNIDITVRKRSNGE